jgi:hypothetical protein
MCHYNYFISISNQVLTECPNVLLNAAAIRIEEIGDETEINLKFSLIILKHLSLIYLNGKKLTKYSSAIQQARAS